MSLRKWKRYESTRYEQAFYLDQKGKQESKLNEEIDKDFEGTLVA